MYSIINFSYAKSSILKLWIQINVYCNSPSTPSYLIVIICLKHSSLLWGLIYALWLRDLMEITEGIISVLCCPVEQYSCASKYAWMHDCMHTTGQCSGIYYFLFSWSACTMLGPKVLDINLILLQLQSIIFFISNIHYGNVQIRAKLGSCLLIIQIRFVVSFAHSFWGPYSTNLVA